MRIAIEARHATTRPTGLGAVAIELVRALADVASDDELIVYAPHPSPLEALKERPNVTLACPLPDSATRIRQLYWQYVTVPRDARRRGADLFHATSYVAPRRAPEPVVLTVHDVIALDHPEWCPRLNALHFRRALPKSIGRARRAIVPTEAVRQRVMAHTGRPAETIDTIYHGVPSDLLEPADPAIDAKRRRAMGIPERYLLFLGNLEPKKNILHIAEAFTELRRRNPNAPSLVLAGKKGWRHGAVLHKLSNFLGRDDVQWIGYVTAEERAALYRGAVSTLLVSREEGFGLPVIESMACGAPVVVSDAPALVEVAGAAAPVVPMDDRDALVMELERLAGDAAYRSQWAEAGLLRAAQFTWRRAAELTLDTYRRALNADARRTDFKEQP